MKKVLFTQGKFALIDDEDFEKVNQYKWYWFRGYAIRTTDKLRMHRFILNYYGKLDIDHINGNRADNRKENLRICTRSQNMLNLKKEVGAYWDKNKKKWASKIMINRKTINLGRFNTREEALRRYQEFKPFLKINGSL